MTCVVIYGREPIVGLVKTRLASSVGGERATAVYRILLDHAVREVKASGLRGVLSVSESPSAGWREGIDLPVEVQCDGELGRRLTHTFARRFAEGCSRVVVVGSDCPGLKAGHVLAAVDKLADVPVVFGPAEDGGYWLLGQRAPGLDLFTDIPWSSPGTLDATRDKMRQLGVTWVELERLADVDTSEDLERAVAFGEIDQVVKERLGSVMSKVDEAQ